MNKLHHEQIAAFLKQNASLNQSHETDIFGNLSTMQCPVLHHLVVSSNNTLINTIAKDTVGKRKELIRLIRCVIANKQAETLEDTCSSIPSAKLEATICREYQQGISSYKLDRKYGVGIGGTNTILKRHNIKMRSQTEAQRLRRKKNRKPNITERNAEICRRYKDGETQQHIADELNIHYSTVSRILKKSGCRNSRIYTKSVK